MSTVNVSVDDKLICLGVHWNTGLEAAEKQFAEWGFRGISDFAKVAVMNGNAARTHVRDTVLSRKGSYRYYWQGSYDWGVGNDSAVYEFEYDLYAGEDTVSGPDAQWMASWRAPDKVPKDAG